MPTLSQADLDHIDLALEFHQSNYDNAMIYPAKFMFIAFPIVSSTTPKPLTPPPSTPTLDLDNLVRQIKAQWNREQALQRKQGFERAQELQDAASLVFNQEYTHSDSTSMSFTDRNRTGKYISISDAYPSPETQMMQAQEAEMKAREAEIKAQEAEIKAKEAEIKAQEAERQATTPASLKYISPNPDATASFFARHLRKFHSTKKEFRIQTRYISPPFDLRSGGPEIVRGGENKPERLRRIWAHVCPARLRLF
ncbi:hypothetical protein HWV62_16372 [Athelia sp. TMB]|nr:hypothetical protein HWV62_16372 [Athelia sp. TMB]